MVLLVPRTTREWLSTKGFFFIGLSVSLLYFWTTRGAGWKSSFWKVCPEWRVQPCSDSSPGLKWNQRCFSSRLPVIFALCKYTVLHLELTKKQNKNLKEVRLHTVMVPKHTLSSLELINVCWESLFSLKESLIFMQCYLKSSWFELNLSPTPTEADWSFASHWFRWKQM